MADNESEQPPFFSSNGARSHPPTHPSFLPSWKQRWYILGYDKTVT